MTFPKRGGRSALAPLLVSFLALLLVISQQQAALHLLGHDLAQLSEPRQKDTSDPQEPLCAKCLAVAHFDHVVGVAWPAVAPIAATFPAVVAVASRPVDLAFVADYRSRAPPSFS